MGMGSPQSTTRRGGRTARTSLLTTRATLILRCTKARLYYPRLMSRPFEKATLADAVGRLRPGMKVLLPAGCGDPTALLSEILRQADRLAPLTLMGGLRLDDYPFAAAAYAGKLRFATWHHSPRLADAQARGDVDFVPIRYFDTVSVFAGGARGPPTLSSSTARRRTGPATSPSECP